MKSDIEIAQEAVMQPIKGFRRMTWSFTANIKPSSQMNCGKR